MIFIIISICNSVIIASLGTAICVNISVNSMLGLILSILRIQCRNRTVAFRLICSVRFRYACFINNINLRIATDRALVITLYFDSDMCTVSAVFPNTGILNIINKDIIVFTNRLDNRHSKRSNQIIRICIIICRCKNTELICTNSI